jgi:hypothetical protein
MRKDTASFMMEGLVAGLVGYAAVVLFFVAVNLFAGRSIFYTAALLGGGLLGGAPAQGTPVVAVGPVVAYNMVHLLVFLVLGTFGAFVVAKTERFPALWVLALLAAIVVGASALMALFFWAAPLLGGGAWWQLVVASALAAGLMAWYLLARHPRLRHELGDIAHSSADV